MNISMMFLVLFSYKKMCLYFCVYVLELPKAKHLIIFNNTHIPVNQSKQILIFSTICFNKPYKISLCSLSKKSETLRKCSAINIMA